MSQSKHFYMKSWFIIIIGIFILGILGYNQLTEKITSPKLESIEINDLSKLMLELNDFPEGKDWTLKDRFERAQSDVSKVGIERGWIRGYYSSYLLGDLDVENMDYSRIDIYVSEYPLENITLSMETQETTNFTKFELLSDPNIGDESKAYKVTDYNLDLVSYWIEFRKYNLKYTVIGSGTRTDYELLKKLARETGAKI